jgi:hypothetical protein
MSVKINNTCIDKLDHLYMYKADLENRLGYGTNVKTGSLSLQLYDEESRAFETLTPEALTKMFSQDGDTVFDARDAALRARYQKTKGSKQIQFMGDIHHGLFQQDKFLPPQTSLEIIFDRNSPELYLLTDQKNDKKYEFAVDTMHLLVRRVKTTAAVTMDEEKLCVTENIDRVFPIRHVAMKSITYGGTCDELQTSNITAGGVVPKRIIFALIRNKAKSGSYGFDPFNYQHFKTTGVSVRCDGAPNGMQEVAMDFSDNKQMYYMALRQLLSSVDSLFNNVNDIGLNVDNYKSRNVMHGFRLTPAQTASKYGEASEKMQGGELTVNMKLEEAPAHSVCLMVYTEYDAEIRIDRDRTVSLGFFQNKQITRNQKKYIFVC